MRGWQRPSPRPSRMGTRRRSFAQPSPSRGQTARARPSGSSAICWTSRAPGVRPSGPSACSSARPGSPLPGGGGLTTPGPVELQRVLRALADRGVTALAMEVSSHSLDQRRIAGIALDAAVFTNLTRDHLDYHRTMGAYFAAKAKLLSYLRPTGACVANADDSAWRAAPAGRTYHLVLGGGQRRQTCGRRRSVSARAAATGTSRSPGARRCRCAFP